MLSADNIPMFRSIYEDSIRTQISSFHDHFDRIKHLITEKQNKILSEFLANYEKCKSAIQSAQEQIEHYTRIEAPFFNVFSILGLERYEVSTHTSFLASILCPYGLHGQGPLFLKLFLEQVLGFSEQDASYPGWYVLKETEQIDLRLANDALRCGVFIENKIDTQAHSGQLSRYFDLWKKKYGRGAFIYLTINGDAPPDEGFDDAVRPKDEVLSETRMLSYKRDIAGWLEKSLEFIQSPKVSYTILQYLHTIKNL